MKNRMNGKGVVVMALSLASTGGLAMGVAGREKVQGGTVVVEGRYYCNVKALTPAERAQHEALTKKLLEKRREVIETEKGYEFQYAPEDVSVAEVAQWVVAESKCCPFFDFHIDLENKGKLICLRLTGGEGIKPFLRAEFGLK